MHRFFFARSSSVLYVTSDEVGEANSQVCRVEGCRGYNCTTEPGHLWHSQGGRIHVGHLRELLRQNKSTLSHTILECCINVRIFSWYYQCLRDILGFIQRLYKLTHTQFLATVLSAEWRPMNNFNVIKQFYINNFISTIVCLSDVSTRQQEG